jgi:hypothetical protein
MSLVFARRFRVIGDALRADASQPQWTRQGFLSQAPSCGRSWRAGEEASRRWRYGLQGQLAHDAAAAVGPASPPLGAPSGWRGAGGADADIEG